MNIKSLALILICSMPLMVHADGSAKVGEKAYAAKGCIGCHGPAGHSSNPAVYPVIKGKKADYLVTQLKAFRAKERKNPMMSLMAAGLSDAEIVDIAAYLSTSK